MSSFFPERAPNPEAALRDLKSARPAARRSAAEALGDVDPDDRALADRARAALIAATNDLRPEVRAAAVLSLGELPNREAVDAIIRCLDDGNSEVRQSAAVALGTAGDPHAVPALIAALQAGSPDLRFQAATSLAEVDAEAAREPLLAALDDDDAEVLGAVAVALGAIGEQRARERLAALLGEHGGKTLFDLAYALADLGDERAVESLKLYLAREEFGWDAVVALERAGGRDALAALDDALTRHQHRSKGRVAVLGGSAIMLRAAAAALRLGATAEALERARTVLAAGLRARKLEHRGLAVELIADVGSGWAVPALEDLGRRRAGRALRSELDDALARLRSHASRGGDEHEGAAP